jgi:hypothetical protein
MGFHLKSTSYRDSSSKLNSLAYLRIGLIFIGLVKCDGSEALLSSSGNIFGWSLQPSKSSRLEMGSAFIALNPISTAQSCASMTTPIGLRVFGRKFSFFDTNKSPCTDTTVLFDSPGTRTAKLQPSIMMRSLPGRPVSLKKELKSTHKVVV